MGKRGQKRAAEGPIKKESFCVMGLEGKELAAKMEYKLRTVPKHVKDHYEEHFKTAKTATSAGKQEFIKHLLENTGNWMDPYFESMKTATVTQKDVKDGKWISWKQILDKENEKVAALMIKQKKIQCRPHAGLDHSDPDVMELEWHDRTQFMYVVDGAQEVASVEEGIAITCQPKDSAHVEGPPALPIEDEEAKEKKKRTRNKTALCNLKRARNMWLSNEPTFASRLKKFETNECPQK